MKSYDLLIAIVNFCTIMAAYFAGYWFGGIQVHRQPKRIIHDLLKALRLSGTYCEVMNHPRGFEHELGDMCPCETFVADAVEAAEEWLKEVK